MNRPAPPVILLHEAVDDDVRRAVIAANPTQNHHYIAQVTQRQFAHNPNVNTQNQNLYRWRFSPGHRLRRYLHRIYHHHEAANEAAFMAVIRQRPDCDQPVRNHRFHWQSGQYARWLAALYGMMCDHDCTPSWFEQLAASLLAEPQQMRIRLHLYDEGQCLLPDSGFVLATDAQGVHLGFAPAADMLLHFSLSHAHWRALPQTARLCHRPATLPLEVCRNHHPARLRHNRNSRHQAVAAVYGQSPVAEAYG